MWLLSPGWAFQLSSYSLQLPASNQGQGCPSAWEERSGLPMADASQSAAVSPGRSSIRVDGANVQSWPQDLPIKHQPARGKSCPVPTLGAGLAPLRTGSPPSPLRDMAGVGGQEKGQWGPMGTSRVAEVTDHFARPHQHKHPPRRDVGAPGCP